MDSLVHYQASWSELHADFSVAVDHGTLSEGTISVAHSVASRVSAIADCFMELQQEMDSLTVELHSDMDTISQGVSDISLSLTVGFNLILAKEHSTPFIASAYSWLLDNLHNPYPSPAVKSSLAAAHGAPISSVNGWFVNVRRRMGWTALCREHFQNCRADAVDAAYRALVKEDPQRRLSPEVIHTFMVMKVAAEGLYSSAFTKSALAGDLDAVVKDMTEEGKQLVEDEQQRLAEEWKFSKEKEMCRRQRVLHRESSKTSAARDSYPSPDRSRIHHHPVPTSRRDERDVLYLQLSAGLQTSLHHPLEPMTASPYDHIYGRSRSTRRLSDADASCVPKRPRDPLPRTDLEGEHSIDEWFNTNFDALFALPPPVDAAEPDFSAPWEVELFSDYSLPQDPRKCTSKSLSLTQDSQTSASRDLAELESLLQSIQSGEFVTPSETANSSSTSLTAHFSDSTSYHVPLPSDLSHPLDWTELLNSTEAFVPTIDSTFPQFQTVSQSLPEIDLSILQLPQVMPTVTSKELASKQAKLDQLQAMQEAIRQMQNELQSEGVALCVSRFPYLGTSLLIVQRHR
ncbi:hypothetical protein BU15DRAFT_85472 [Melanogaster broomeanus]|nr:hypothetical protein BU15DRAFT_85472 [Melanogaster broomeanus]